MDVIITSAEPNNVTITCDKPNIIYVVGAQPVNVTISFNIPNQSVSQSLKQTLLIGNATDGENIVVNDDDAVQLENGSLLKKGTYDFGANGGISRICGVGFEDMWQSGIRHVFDSNGFIRNSTNCFNIVPDANFDITLRFKIGSIWTLDDGTSYICFDATEGAAVWGVYNAIPTKTSNLTNDGADGVNPFITVLDIPFIPTNTSDLTNDSDFVSDENYVHTDNNFTNILKTKLDSIADGAEVNVNADWNAVSGDAQILNKPTIPSITNLVPYTGATQNVDLGEFELKGGQITLDTTPTGTPAVATTRWNDANGTSETTLKGGNVILKNGVDLVARIVNKVTPNTTLTKAAYQVVKVSGAQGQRLAVDLAQGNTDLNSADTLGIVTETIATNQEGFIMTVGQLEGINTTGSLQSETWADGDVLYLSPTTAGRITNIKPTGATGHIVILGYVEYAHANNGKIYVKIMNGWELDELHNVYISSVANNQILTYESATQLWKNKNLNQIVSERRNANDTSNNSINYCGTAANGSAESTAVWIIKRLTIASSGSITIATATNVAWTDRETTIYT